MFNNFLLLEEKCQKSPKIHTCKCDVLSSNSDEDIKLNNINIFNWAWYNNKEVYKHLSCEYNSDGKKLQIKWFEPITFYFYAYNVCEFSSFGFLIFFFFCKQLVPRKKVRSSKYENQQWIGLEHGECLIERNKVILCVS